MAVRPSVIDDVVRDRAAATGAVEVLPLAPVRADRTGVMPAGSGRSLAPRVRVRRAVTLIALSVLLPGSAQLVAGNRRVGLVALRVWAALSGAVLLFGLLLLVDRASAVSLVARPWLLALVGTVCLALAAAVPALVVDAWRLGRPGDLPALARRWLAAGTVAVVALTATPLVMSGRRFWSAADLVGGVFGGNTAAGASQGRYNVLLLGGDAGQTRVGLRPDSVTLASVDATTGRTVLFSFPRNLQNIPFPPGTPAARALPDGWSCGDDCLLNAIYGWGNAHPDLFPGARDPGAEAMKQAVSGITGLQVPYYVMVDLHGFRALIDAMGGIELTVAERVPIGGGTSPVSGYIEPGRRHLNGFRALWYARSREGSSDYERMQRQRCVMTAMAAQLDPATLLRRFQKIAAAGQDVVSTDVPASDLGTFLDLGLAAKGRRITSVQFVPPIIVPKHPDYPALRARVDQAIAAAEKDRPSKARAGGGSATPSPAASARPLSPSAPGTDTDVDGTDVRAVCTV